MWFTCSFVWGLYSGCLVGLYGCVCIGVIFVVVFEFVCCCECLFGVFNCVFGVSVCCLLGCFALIMVHLQLLLFACLFIVAVDEYTICLCLLI